MTCAGEHARAWISGARVRSFALLAILLAALMLPAASAGSRRPSRRAQFAAIDRLIARGLPVYCGGGRGRYVALTFDDGPGPYTSALLDVLARHRAKATFFVIGEHAVERPRLVRREQRYGAIGDHTWSHPVLTTLSPAEIERELEVGQTAPGRILGHRLRLFRPPFGARNAMIDAKVNALGMLEVLWSVDSGDASEPSTPPPAKIADNLAARIRPGAIVLLHENITGTPSIEAVDTFLPVLRERGLIPVSVPQLLALDPPTLEQQQKGRGGCN